MSLCIVKHSLLYPYDPVLKHSIGRTPAHTSTLRWAGNFNSIEKFKNMSGVGRPATTNDKFQAIRNNFKNLCENIHEKSRIWSGHSSMYNSQKPIKNGSYGDANSSTSICRLCSTKSSRFVVHISNSSLDQNFLRSTFQMSGIVRTQKSRV